VAKLIVNPTSPARRELQLTRTLVSIGRDPSNDLVLPDAMVSRRHAVIEYRGAQYFLRDCNSSNGSLINGDRVSERSLRDGDLVAIGTARLLFRDEIELEELGSKVLQHPSAPKLQCPACHSDYRKSDLFCRHCGTSLAPPPAPKAVCVSCGAGVTLPARYCNVCGTALPTADLPDEATRPRPAIDLPSPRPSAEGAAAPALETTLETTPSPVVTTPPPPPAPMVTAVDEPMPVVVAPPPPRSRPRPESLRRSVPAALGARFAAGLVDLLLVGAVQAILMGPALAYWIWPPAEVRFLPILFSLSLVPVALTAAAAYFVYFWGVQGATPGKKLFGLAVEAGDGTYPIGITRAAIRTVGYLISAGILGIGFLMIALTGAGLHDRLADTRVVRRERG
jgi:uncharacterized RDD family membrane protein YckC